MIIYYLYHFIWNHFLVSDTSYNQEAWPKKKKEFRRLKAEKYKQNRQDPKFEKAARLGHCKSFITYEGHKEVWVKILHYQ